MWREDEEENADEGEAERERRVSMRKTLE